MAGFSLIARSISSRAKLLLTEVLSTASVSLKMEYGSVYWREGLKDFAYLMFLFYFISLLRFDANRNFFNKHNDN